MIYICSGLLSPSSVALVCSFSLYVLLAILNIFWDRCSRAFVPFNFCLSHHTVVRFKGHWSCNCFSELTHSVTRWRLPFHWLTVLDFFSFLSCHFVLPFLRSSLVESYSTQAFSPRWSSPSMSILHAGYVILNSCELFNACGIKLQS